MLFNEYFDENSCLHVASGITAYYWGLSLKKWIFLHILFTIIENTSIGINFTKKYLSNFKPYKMGPDSIKNLIGDTIGAAFGWLLAYLMAKISSNNPNSGRSKLEDHSFKCKLKKWLQSQIGSLENR